MDLEYSDEEAELKEMNTPNKRRKKETIADAAPLDENDGKHVQSQKAKRSVSVDLFADIDDAVFAQIDETYIASMASSTNQKSKRKQSAGFRPWKCGWCGELEHHVTRGTFVMKNEWDDWNFEPLDICKLCHDKQNGLRPELDESGNVKDAWMSICCPTCRSSKRCKYHEPISQWQAVAMKSRLNNESKTEEWQVAFKAMYGKKEEDVYLECPYRSKDECKRLGGRWDPDEKKWFVPKGMDCEPFSQWIPM